MDTTTLGCLADLLAEQNLLISGSALTVSANPARNLVVTGAAHDSRAVLPGNVFICKGVRFEPRYLSLALEAGATSYLCAEELAAILAPLAPDVPALVVHDVRKAMSLVGRAAWGYPDKKLSVVGITGSNGKTTTTYMLRSILDAESAKPRAGLIGSVEFFDGITSRPSTNTTPEAAELWHLLANAADNKLTVVMEVSSQGLKYGRVEGITFDVGAITNIGRDHISPIEHPSLEDYVASKLKMFTVSREIVLLKSLLERDDVVAAAHSGNARITTFSPTDTTADVWASEVVPSNGGTTFVAHTPTWTGPITLRMPGTYNVDNALGAIALAQRLGIGQAQIASGLLATQVPGRMECVASASGDIVGIIDFAHNGQSFERFFASVAQEYPDRYLVSVFGCAGMKGLERRRQLPPIATRYCDMCIYTEDDPGAEPVSQIIGQMVDATPEGAVFEIIENREQAVARAIQLADAQTKTGRKALVCVLGKGDELRILREIGPVPCERDRTFVERYLGRRDAAER